MEILLNDDCSEKVAYDFADFPVFIHRELLSEYPNRTAPSHWHTDLEFLLIYSGRLQYNVNGFVRTLHAGEGIFVNAQQLYFGFSDRDEECEFLCVLVHPTLLCTTPAIQQRFVLPVLQNEALPCLYLTPGVPWQGELLSHLRQINAIQAAGGPGRLLRLEAEFFALWGLLFEHCPAGQPAAAHGADLDSIRRMVGFVQQCYPQKLLLRQIAAISSRGSSRESTTRLHPSSAAATTPSSEWMDICVEACTATSGAISRQSCTMPRSCTMNASTPSVAASRMTSAARAISRSATSVFSVRCTATPRTWQ